MGFDVVAMVGACCVGSDAAWVVSGLLMARGLRAPDGLGPVPFCGGAEIDVPVPDSSTSGSGKDFLALGFRVTFSCDDDVADVVVPDVLFAVVACPDSVTLRAPVASRTALLMAPRVLRPWMLCEISSGISSNWRLWSRLLALDAFRLLSRTLTPQRSFPGLELISWKFSTEVPQFWACAAFSYGTHSVSMLGPLWIYREIRTLSVNSSTMCLHMSQCTLVAKSRGW